MDAANVIVPMRCEALMVNAGVTGDPTCIWQFDYENLADFRSPEPPGCGTTAAAKLEPGVYLHWTLPDAFRAGRQQDTAGEVTFPLVPNRWLVLRLSSTGSAAPAVKAMVVESDCPFTAGVTPGPYVEASNYWADDEVQRAWKASSEPHRKQWVPLGDGSMPLARIGVRYPLEGWSEQAAGEMFLTAVAPANPAFSGYFPHHRNVFGTYDDLSDLSGAQTLSYYVVGWYSDPAGDLAAGGSDAAGAAALLDRLNWSVAGGAAGTFGRSFCVGACFNMAWDPSPEAAAPADPGYRQSWGPGGRTLNFGVGNSVTDAFTSLTNVLVKDDGMATLLRAFSADRLRLLNEVNGAALLDEALRRDWFGSIEGGTRWTIVERDSDGRTGAPLNAFEAAALQQLNDDQSALDDTLGKTHTQQWALNALWFKAGYAAAADNFPDPPGPPKDIPDPSAFTDALNPDVAGTPAQQLVASLQQVQAGLAKVPRPIWDSATNRSDAFAAGIAKFASDRHLDEAKQLKAVPAPRYWQAANPVVVISGVKPAYEADPSQPTIVRLSSQVSASFTAAGRQVSRDSAASAFAGLPSLGSLPGGAARLVDELFLLDPANAAALAAASGIPAAEVEAVAAEHPDGAYDGVLPAFDLADWAQPWSPLFLEWKGAFLPVDGDGSWSFDGTDYVFKGSGTPPPPQTLRGRSLLSPHAQFLFGSRLKKFLDQFGKDNPALAHLYDEIEKIYQWQFLAQELVGFGDALSGRDGRPFRRPLPTETVGSGGARLADLIGYDDPDAGSDALPDSMRGRVTTAPLIPTNPIAFQGVRQGQFYFQDLFLYDRFGRRLVLASSVTDAGVNDYRNFPAVIDPALKASTPLDAKVASVMQLPPRVLQPMRLDAQWLDRQGPIDKAKLLSKAPDACPVCAWLIPNHLDNSLLLFAPDGTSWGEVRLVVGTDGTKTAEWAPPPHGSIASTDDFAAASPDLAAMIGSTAFKNADNFAALLSAIDSTLWTIDPLGGRADQNLSVLVGRPLALARLRLQFQLAGEPRRDTGWKATFDTAPPAWLEQEFAVRLGDQATRQDGTIGYFSGRFDSFNSVAAPEPGAPQTYVNQIGPLGTGDNYLKVALTDDSYAYATVLLDPRAAVHATTGLLPVLPIRLPVQFVDAPLSRLELAFRTGPLLSVIQPAASQGNAAPAFPDALTYPLPTERNGTWSWWEAGADAPTGYSIDPATVSAHFLPAANSLREGALAFTVNLAAKD